MKLNNLSDNELIALYPELLKELKSRKIIRTKNLIGDLGEHIAESIYKKDSSLPIIELTYNSTKNIDAVSRGGERYAIKSASGAGTGVFSSLPLEDDGVVYFEYLVFVIFNKDYILKEIFELTWKDFLRFRNIKLPENKWYLPIKNSLKESTRKIFSA